MDEDIVAIIALTILVGIPVLAISARIALKPVVEAILRMKEGLGGDTAALQARRFQRLEAELDGLRDEVEHLRDVAEFHRRLEAPGASSPTAGGMADGADPARSVAKQ